MSSEYFDQDFIKQAYPATKNARKGIPRRHSPWICVDIGYKTVLEIKFCTISFAFQSF